jgi:3-oxoadipate enol-lactonase
MKINLNGITINYELSGQDGAPAVMLSHSLACSLVMWQPQMEVLESAFQVLRFDTRGHGDSDAPQGAYSLEQLTADAVHLLDALNIETVHYVGLSMGGMIGQCLALDYSERLRSLALCDTAAVMPEESQPIWQQRIDAASQTGMADQVDETLERWFRPEYLELNHPAVEMIRQQILATPVAGYVGCCEAIRRLDYLDRLSGIKMPTLIMVGEEDPGTPVAASEAMHAKIAGSKLVILPKARHLSNIEQAQAFNAALMEFLIENK